MEPVKFVAVTQQAQVHMVCELAARIWKEHYTPIIGGEQVDYMLETLQSVPAVTRQMEQEGYQYYLLETGGRTAGYVGIQPGGGKLFLSKLYVDKPFRGKKLARRALEFLEQYCREHGLSVIWLTVNRHNDDSIAAYHALGFQTVRQEVADIGHGYVMDDFIMEYEVK